MRTHTRTRAAALAALVALTGCAIPIGPARLGVSLTRAEDGNVGVGLSLAASCVGLAAALGLDDGGACMGLRLLPPPPAASDAEAAPEPAAPAETPAGGGA